MPGPQNGMKRQIDISSFFSPAPTPRASQDEPLHREREVEGPMAGKRPRLDDDTADNKEGGEDPFILELGPQRNFTLVYPRDFNVRDALSTPTNKGRVIQKGTLDLLLFKAFLVAPARQKLYRYLLDELPWYRVTYEIRGTTIRTPRFTTVFGIDDANPKPLDMYTRRPRQIPPVLLELKRQVELRLGDDTHFNFVLCNYYQDGKDSISYHSDDESFLGPNPTIASLTLGSPRDFLMRPKADQKASGSQIAESQGGDKTKPKKWTLESGDMIVMRGTTQSTWEHSIPKRTQAGGRINITFRKAINSQGTNNYYRYNVGDGPIHRFVTGRMQEQP